MNLSSKKAPQAKPRGSLPAPVETTVFGEIAACGSEQKTSNRAVQNHCRACADEWRTAENPRSHYLVLVAETKKKNGQAQTMALPSAPEDVRTGPPSEWRSEGERSPTDREEFPLQGEPSARRRPIAFSALPI